MTTREKFKRRIIELIHGEPYEEAIRQEVEFGCELKYHNYNNKLQVIEDEGNGGIWIREADKDNWFEKINKLGEYDEFEIIGLPITIGRIMQALYNFLDSDDDINYCLYPSGDIYKCSAGNNFPPEVIGIEWKLTKENSQECTDDDQTDETIEKLYNLIK